MGSLTEIPSRSWKRIEAVFLGDCDRSKLATSEGTHALDERSVQRPRETPVP